MEHEDLEARLGYVFRDRGLLEEALTHTSFVNEHKEAGARDNQRLEFLGDTVVNAAVTRLLFLRFPQEREGGLTKFRAEIINEASLARIALAMDLGGHLRLGKGEELDGGRLKPSLLADAFEALMGAVFRDSSFEVVCSLVEDHITRWLGPMDQISITDYKSALLECCQSVYHCLPEILIVDERGPDHDKIFVAQVLLAGEVVGAGEGRSKKMASQMACKESLTSLGYLPS